jgi:DNA mismatch repair protein MutS
MAGMPYAVLKRAEEVLHQLESARATSETKPQIKKKEESYQLSFINLDDPLLLEVKEQIIDTDIDRLTPVEALMKLNEIKNLLVKNKK